MILETKKIILNLCKTLNKKNVRITDDDLMELYAVDDSDFYNKYCEININFLNQKLNKAIPLFEMEYDSNRKKMMNQKIHEWQKELIKWKKLIV